MKTKTLNKIILYAVLASGLAGASSSTYISKTLNDYVQIYKEAYRGIEEKIKDVYLSSNAKE